MSRMRHAPKLSGPPVPDSIFDLAVLAAIDTFCMTLHPEDPDATTVSEMGQFASDLKEVVLIVHTMAVARDALGVDRP